MHANKTTLILCAVLTCSLLTGCTDGNKLKKDVQASLSKQVEMKNYTFSGDADLDLAGLPTSADSNPVTSGLLAMFQSSKLEWTGVTNKDPLRLEMNLKATPSGSGAALELPMIFKDNKLYVNIPLINKKDEYFVIDTAQPGTVAGQNSSLSPDSLKNVTQTTTTIFTLLVSNLDSKWFNQTAPVTLKDGKKGTVITIAINEKNKQEFTAAMQTKMPEMIDSLSQSGLINAQQADKMKQNQDKTISFSAPGLISLTIDSEGFIRTQQVNLSYTQAGKNGTPANRHLILDQTYDQINQNPAFEKEIPKLTKPFSDVLKLLGGNKK